MLPSECKSGHKLTVHSTTSSHCFSKHYSSSCKESPLVNRWPSWSAPHRPVPHLLASSTPVPPPIQSSCVPSRGAGQHLDALWRWVLAIFTRRPSSGWWCGTLTLPSVFLCQYWATEGPMLVRYLPLWLAAQGAFIPVANHCNPTWGIVARCLAAPVTKHSATSYTYIYIYKNKTILSKLMDTVLKGKIVRSSPDIEMSVRWNTRHRQLNANIWL